MKKIIAAITIVVGLGLVVTQVGGPAYAAPTPDRTGAVPAGSIRANMTACLRSSGVTGAPDDLSMLSDLEAAQQTGYGVSIERRVASSTNPKDAPKVNDCATKVRANTRERQLTGKYGDLVKAMQHAGVTTTADDFPDGFILGLPGGAEALADWQACTGRSYVNPAASQADFEQRISRTRPQQLAALQAEERAVATADVACRDRVLYPALTTVVTNYIEQHQ